jgi:hypothetical protein
MNYVVGLGRLAASIQNKCPGAPTLVYGEDGLGGKEADCWLDGARLSTGVFASVVNRLVEKTDVHMFDNVLQGLNTDWVEEMLDADTHSGGIADVLKKATPYYSFLTEPSNSTLLDHRDDLIMHLFGTAGLWREYVRLEEGGKLVAEPQGLEAWAKNCDKLIEMMNLLLIFTMGQPPRCKEVESFLICNTTTSRRSFYWTRGTLVLL